MRAWLILLVVIAFSFLGFYLYSVKPRVLYHNDEGHLWVYDRGPFRCLSFVPPGNIVQSCISRSSPNKIFSGSVKMLAGGIMLTEAPRKILLLGLGGGSIVNALNHLVPEADIDVVEIRSDLVDIAYEYFGLPDSHNIHIFVADAVQFIHKNYTLYDMIIVNVFVSDYAPEESLKETFAKDVLRALAPHGVVVVNSLREKDTDQISDVYGSVFGSFFTLNNVNNTVFWMRSGGLPSPDSLNAMADQWEKRLSRVGVNPKWILEKIN